MENVETFAGIGDYVPPDPIAPKTFDQALGMITADKRAAYTIMQLL